MTPRRLLAVLLGFAALAVAASAGPLDAATSDAPKNVACSRTSGAAATCTWSAGLLQLYRWTVTGDGQADRTATTHSGTAKVTGLATGRAATFRVAACSSATKCGTQASVGIPAGPGAPTTTQPPTTTTLEPVTTTAGPTTTTAAPTTTTSAPPATGSPVFAGTFWTTPLPPSTPVNPAGTGYGAKIAQMVSTYYGHADLNVLEYAPNVYTVPGGTPTVAVTAVDCLNSHYLDPGFVDQMRAVPMPANAAAPADSDAHVVIWQPSTDTMWELWRAAKRTNGTWTACWGGRMDHVSSSTGVFPNPYGATASGLPLLGGLVTVAEVRAGHIDHAIAIALPEIRAGAFSWPANRTDGTTNSASAIAEGQRLRLDPSIDLDGLGLPPITRMIAAAMQRYGVVVRDVSGSVTLYAESSGPYTAAGLPNPYPPYFGGTESWALLDKLPWASLIALPFDDGKPSG